MKTTRGRGWEYYCHKCGTSSDRGMNRQQVDDFAATHRMECSGMFPADDGPLKPIKRIPLWPSVLSYK